MVGSSGGITVSGGGSGSSGGTSFYAQHAGEAEHAVSANTADDATHATSATDVDSDSPAYSRWLRKDQADTAAGLITFTSGLVSNAASTFNEVVTFVKKITANAKAWFKQGISVGASEEYGWNADGSMTTGSIAVSGNVSVTGNTTVSGSVTAARLIADLLKTPNFTAAAGMIGLGFGVTTDQNGKATLQTDDLLVLGKMIVNSLNIREVSYIGGTYLLTPAGSTVAKIMPLYAGSGYGNGDTYHWTTTGSGTVVGYRLLWKADDDTTGTMNYWRQGDQAFCETFNITEPGAYTTASNRRYWRLVCRVGQTTIDNVVWHYADVANVAVVNLYNANGIAILNVDGSEDFTGYENNSGSVPSEGDKVVCLGSQADTSRQGAVQITAEGVASIGIYDGIKAFNPLANYEIHFFSKDAVRMKSSMVTWKKNDNTTQTQASFMSDVNGLTSTVSNMAGSGQNLLLGTDGYTSSSTALVHTSSLSNGGIQYKPDNSGTKIYTVFNLVKDKTYVFQCMSDGTLASRHNTSQTGKYTVWLRYFGDEAHNHCFTSSNLGGTTTGGAKWWVFTPQMTGTYYFRTNTYSDGSTPVTVNFWNIMLELGDTPSTWVAPKRDGTTSFIQQTADSISAGVQTSVEGKLYETGIDIQGNNREIDIRADKFTVRNSSGAENIAVNAEGWVDFFGCIRPRAVYYNLGGLKTINGVQTIDLTTDRGNTYILPGNTIVNLPEATDLEGLELTLLFRSGAILNAVDGMYISYYSGNTGNTMMANVLASTNGTEILTIQALNGYGSYTSLKWTVKAQRGIIGIRYSTTSTLNAGLLKPDGEWVPL